MQPVTAVVPLKALGAAKRRLAVELDAGQRRELVAWMLHRVVAACRGASAVGTVVVVAGDEEAAALGRATGARVLIEVRPGLRRALATADDATRLQRATLVLAADLPLAQRCDVDAVCAEAAAGEPVVVVAPTRDGGTAALLRQPPTIVATAYGRQSAAAHLRLAAAAGVRAVRLDVPRLALDVDTPAALREATRGSARLLFG